MPEIDYEAEYHRLYERMVELEKAQDELATAGIKDSARWEQERDALLKELRDAYGTIAEFVQSNTEVGKMNAELQIEINELRAILRFAVTNKSNFCEHDPDGIKAAWIESAEDALLKE